MELFGLASIRSARTNPRYSAVSGTPACTAREIKMDWGSRSQRLRFSLVTTPATSGWELQPQLCGGSPHLLRWYFPRKLWSPTTGIQEPRLSYSTRMGRYSLGSQEAVLGWACRDFVAINGVPSQPLDLTEVSWRSIRFSKMLTVHYGSERAEMGCTVSIKGKPSTLVVAMVSRRTLSGGSPRIARAPSGLRQTRGWTAFTTCLLLPYQKPSSEFQNSTI